MKDYILPLDTFYLWEKTRPDRIYLSQPIDGKAHTWTWKQTGIEARKMAAYLKSLGLPPGSNIGLVSKNCAHWIICDLAILMAGHVSVPLYPNLTAESIRKILEHSEAPLLFVGKLDNWPSMRPGVPQGIRCISFPFYPHEGYVQWYDVIEHIKPMEESPTRPEEELMTIIYTSGTTGMPKGVMHSFGAVAFAITEGVKFIGLTDHERFFSYLPLAHVGERLVVEMGSLYSGGTVYYAETIDSFPKNLQDAQPTIFLGVHRIWKKFQEAILTKVPQKKLDLLLKLPLISGLIKKKIKKGLGFTHARMIITAATPTPAELIHWYKKLGIVLLEGYSMTENFGYSHANPPERIKIGTVGTSMPESEVKLGDHNEILVRNRAAMIGYFKEPGMTRDMFTDDGFIRTGDEGHIDEEGYLTITGRTKDIFKTSKGKYVVPSPIEMKISSNADLEFCCVIGTGLPQPMALVTLSENGKKSSREQLLLNLSQDLEQINSSLDAHERLEKIVVIPDAWTVDSGMLTPTFKLIRNAIEKKYKDRFETWYGSRDKIVMT
jgi:long-chain acyl-CoA synthetase